MNEAEKKKAAEPKAVLTGISSASEKKAQPKGKEETMVSQFKALRASRSGRGTGPKK